MAKLSFVLEVCRIPNLNVSVSCESLNCVLTLQFFRGITTFISRLSSNNDFYCLFCRYGEALLRIGGLPNSKFERSGNPTQAIKGYFLNKNFFYKMLSKNFIFNFFFRAMPGATKKFARKFCDWQLCHKSKAVFSPKNAKKIHNCLLFLMLSQKNMWTFHPILRTKYCGEGLQKENSNWSQFKTIRLLTTNTYAWQIKAQSIFFDNIDITYLFFVPCPS